MTARAGDLEFLDHPAPNTCSSTAPAQLGYTWMDGARGPSQSRSIGTARPWSLAWSRSRLSTGPNALRGLSTVSVGTGGAASATSYCPPVDHITLVFTGDHPAQPGRMPGPQQRQIAARVSQRHRQPQPRHRRRLRYRHRARHLGQPVAQ